MQEMTSLRLGRKKMENKLKANKDIWEQIKEIENPKAPTFEEFFNAINSYVKERFSDHMKNIAEENVEFIAYEYRDYLEVFNDGKIDRKAFMNAKVWAVASNLYMM